MARTKSAKADEVIARIRAICLALPEAEEKPFGGHTAPSFRVRDKLFVMTSEPGYSEPSMQCKAGPGAQDVLVHADPARFFVPPYTGHNGWVGVRLDRGGLDWALIEELIRESYRLIAPKRLAAQLADA
jgi:predicted DNA-binding protein (MmcQ/YjbR family)